MSFFNFSLKLCGGEAILSGAKRGAASDTICVEKGGAKTDLASDWIWCIDALLVRASESNSEHPIGQEP